MKSAELTIHNIAPGLAVNEFESGKYEQPFDIVIRTAGADSMIGDIRVSLTVEQVGRLALILTQATQRYANEAEAPGREVDDGSDAAEEHDADMTRGPFAGDPIRDYPQAVVTCPGCKSAIYDDAARDGWCTDCNPANVSREE